MTGRPSPSDYETDPARFRANVAAVERYSLVGDVHADVAERLRREDPGPVLDLGCGEGRLVEPLHDRGMAVIALDRALGMLAAVPAPRVQADAGCVPFPDGCFGGVAALYMLYHLPDPGRAIAESWRVLRPGGLFAACAPSRYNDPELAEVIPPSPGTFDAENGPDLVRRRFTAVEVERWDAPLTHLPDRDALALYLRGRGCSAVEIDRAAASVLLPLTLTKRGALIYGRKGC